MATLILVFAALFGAAVGSFLNVCIFRLPRSCLRLWKPKLSFCPSCARTLEWWENIPIVAYLVLRGRCRRCLAPIPLRYFLVELGTAVLFLYLASEELVPDLRHKGLFLVHAVLGAAFIVCALVDWDHRVIPDEIDIPGFLLAPFVGALVPELFSDRLLHPGLLAGNAGTLLDQALPWWGLSPSAAATLTSPLHGLEHFMASHESLIDPAAGFFTAFVGAAAGAGLIALVGWLGTRVFQKEAMGFGDVKFMAMIGGFTGWQGIFATIVLASVVGSVWGIFHKIRSGKTTVTGKHLAEASPLSYLALRLCGAPAEAADDAVVTLRWGGGLAARFATGDSYLPFGPFLALGAAIYMYWPDLIFRIVTHYAELVARIFRGG